jgi:hypothetical protein
MNININNNILEIEGNITTIKDAEKIINALYSLNNKDTVIVKIKDSFSLPSSIIGELLKLTDMGKKIILEVKDPVLHEMLDDLNLTKTFNVKRI